MCVFGGMCLYLQTGKPYVIKHRNVGGGIPKISPTQSDVIAVVNLGSYILTPVIDTSSYFMFAIFAKVIMIYNYCNVALIMRGGAR